MYELVPRLVLNLFVNARVVYPWIRCSMPRYGISASRASARRPTL